MLENLMREDLQLKNRWFCYFEDFSKSEFLVKSVNLPFEKLITETKKYGDKKYVGFTPIDTITIVFYENTKFEVYKFFKNWMDDIFDSKEKVFNVLSNENVKYKDATILFYRSNAFSQQKDSIKFRFNKLQILGIDEITNDQETGEPLEWTVQLAVKDTTNILETLSGGGATTVPTTSI